MFQKLTLSILFVVGILTLTLGQIRTPAPSPSASLKQTVGLTDISVEYSRPSVKGRTIFSADGLVPFGKIWRTGANSAVKITFSDDVTVEGKALEAGSYAILTRPGATSWDINFYPYESSGWGSYVEKDPAASVTVHSHQMTEKVESFLIVFDELSSDGGTLGFLWENTYVPVKIGVEVDSRVMADIEKTMAGPSAGDYFAAASYMHDSGKDLNKALMYVQKATHTDNPRFWQVRREALILADLGRKSEAVQVAKRSLELAQKAGNDDYVRMNEKSIKEWSM